MLTNVPRIRDVEVMARLLLDLGATVEGHRHARRCACAAQTVTRTSPTARWSAACAGRCCCSARCWRGAAARTWRRPAATFRRAARIATHLEALDRDGRACSVDEPGHVLEAPDGLKPASIYLYEASVTGTETALLAAAAAPGVTEIRHAACEPHVVELCEFLRAAGRRRSPATARRRSASRAGRGCAAPSTGCGATTSKPAAGRSSPRSPAARSRSRGARGTDMEVVAAPLKRMGLQLHARTATCFVVEHVDADRGAAASPPACGPGFPSDLVSLVTVLATQAEGRTLVHDWLYELRLFALEQLSGDERATCSSAIRTASSSPARRSCAAARSTAATCDRGWR